MPSVLDNVASTPNGDMPNGTHKGEVDAVEEEEDCDEPDGDGVDGDGDSDPASEEEPVTVMETGEYKAVLRCSCHDKIEGG